MCDGKDQLLRWQAHARARRLGGDRGAYRCPWGGHWHVGHTPAAPWPSLI